MRLDEGNKIVDGELEALEKRLTREYAKASTEVRKKLQKYWADFARKDEAKKALVDAGKLTQAEYVEWRTNQIYIAGRWTELSKVLAEDFANTNAIANGMMNGTAMDVYAIGHNYATFEVEKASALNTSYTLYNRDAVARLVKDNPDLLPLQTTKKIAKDLRWNKQLLQSAVTQGILQGESVPKIAKRIPRAVGESNYKGAIRRARTMMTSAENAGRLDGYKRAANLGIEIQKEWRATLDGRTRHEHRVVDGERVGLDEKFSNGLDCPGDPSGDPAEVYNCRCRIRAVIKGHERAADDLSRRDTTHFESQNYEDWKKSRPSYGKGAK